MKLSKPVDLVVDILVWFVRVTVGALADQIQAPSRVDTLEAQVMDLRDELDVVRAATTVNPDVVRDRRQAANDSCVGDPGCDRLVGRHSDNCWHEFVRRPPRTPAPVCHDRPHNEHDPPCSICDKPIFQFNNNYGGTRCKRCGVNPCTNGGVLCDECRAGR